MRVIVFGATSLASLNTLVGLGAAVGFCVSI